MLEKILIALGWIEPPAIPLSSRLIALHVVSTTLSTGRHW
jgi:hypothetical protein